LRNFIKIKKVIFGRIMRAHGASAQQQQGKESGFADSKPNELYNKK